MRRAVVKIQILVEGNVLEQFLMTIFSTTEPGNVGATIQNNVELMLQHCLVTALS